MARYLEVSFVMRYAIVLSGGTGSRAGFSIPKQYMEIEGKPLLAFTLERLGQVTDLAGIVIVADPAWQGYIADKLRMAEAGSFSWEKNSYSGIKLLGFALPGENRQLSILSGLRFLKQYVAEKEARELTDEDIVLVQDAARPLTSERLLEACFHLTAEEDGRMPVLPMKDTIYLSEDGHSISGLLDRSKLFAGQAPESFRFCKYLQANESLLPDRILKINGSSEPAMAAGMNIAMIPGEEGNFKITTAGDYQRFVELIEDK